MASEIQQDSKPILQDGTGTPYLAIFDGSGNAIIDPLSNLPIGVFCTDFEYSYDEDKEDTGYIILETNNPDLISIPQLRYQMPIKLQWGWIYPSEKPKCGQVRTVIIIGHEVEFQQEGTHITINFADSSILLKNTPSSYYPQLDGFFDYVKNLLNGSPVGVQLVDYNPSATVAEKVIAKRVIKSEDLQRLK